MLTMNIDSVKSCKSDWNKAKTLLPQYDLDRMRRRTKAAPIWVHFGAGNLFRGFPAAVQQRLLNTGLTDRGMIAVEAFDGEIIDRIYLPFDNLTMLVTLNPDGSTSREVIGSVAEAIRADTGRIRLREIFQSPSLQMVSFTITEKGYALERPDGSLLPEIADDLQSDPVEARHTMGRLTSLLYLRYQAGGSPLALLSMDNCSRNGEKLQNSVLALADGWNKNGFVESGFLTWLRDEKKVAFPWSMIDKITPRPHEQVKQALSEDGICGMTPIITKKGTFIAPFVNAERPQYLVVEDCFPNGRPPFEQAGVFLTDRETVSKAERMKVTACLNPLHTAMSVYGCLLGYSRICDEMEDADITALIRQLGYREGLPVADHPGILEPRAFLDEVIEQRLPNPFMPDTPQRIATDTSQKVGIRFGETIRHYLSEHRDLSGLLAIPLAIAGWLRYLLAVDDFGAPMPVSADPLREELQQQLSGLIVGQPESYQGQLREILQNKAIFGLDLTQTLLAERIETFFISELAGVGAVRRTLHGALSKLEFSE
jgi:fructuronate reductase